MTYPDIPAAVKSMLANVGHRTHHLLWHLVRNRDDWESLSEDNRNALVAEGWAAPRFDRELGSGIDFLGMHRDMIAMVNQALSVQGDANWPSVQGWDPIPWENDNADWPVPEWQVEWPSWASMEEWETYTELAEEARSAAQIDQMRRLSEIFKNPDYLRSRSVDQLGIDMEWSIHGWMHMRWSGAPPRERFLDEPDNDWLFVPWSSHVNKTFWKLHGWIDERITDWETANEVTADFSDAWSGPSAMPGAMLHMAETKLLRHLPVSAAPLMSMTVDANVVGRLLEQ